MIGVVAALAMLVAFVILFGWWLRQERDTVPGSSEPYERVAAMIRVGASLEQVERFVEAQCDAAASSSFETQSTALRSGPVDMLAFRDCGRVSITLSAASEVVCHVRNPTDPRSPSPGPSVASLTIYLRPHHAAELAAVLRPLSSLETRR